MAPNSSIPHLVNFLRSILSPSQIHECIEALQSAVPQVQTLDPEDTRKRMLPVAKPAQGVAAPAGLAEILKEMDEAFSESKNPPLSKDESDRLLSYFPTPPGLASISGRIAAHQGRRLAAMLRERLHV